MKTKIIKRYQNRKLYDTSGSRYITLEDLAKMIKNGEDIVVIDNQTEKNITSNTLMQLIFETEKKTKSLLPISTLRDIIRSSGGSISHFFQKTIKTGEKRIADVKSKIQRGFENVTGISNLEQQISKLEDRVKVLQKKLEKDKNNEAAQNSKHE